MSKSTRTGMVSARWWRTGRCGAMPATGNASRTVWHDDGRMMATWFQGRPRSSSRSARPAGTRASASCISSAASGSTWPAPRAIAQTKMTIRQRAEVHGVPVDVVCTGRFHDFVEKRDGPLGHRAAPADLREGQHGPGRPGRTAQLDAALLARFPEGYRHLAYLQTGIGYKVKTDMPGLKGPEVEALYRAAPLAGGQPLQG